MSHHAKNTEHSGAKHGSSSSFDGRKAEAKAASKRVRRAVGRGIARIALVEATSERPAARG